VQVKFGYTSAAATTATVGLWFLAASDVAGQSVDLCVDSTPFTADHQLTPDIAGCVEPATTGARRDVIYRRQRRSQHGRPNPRQFSQVRLVEKVANFTRDVAAHQSNLSSV